MFKGKHCVHIYSGEKVQQREERIKKKANRQKMVQDI
jgi:hypothetical protein